MKSFKDCVLNEKRDKALDKELANFAQDISFQKVDILTKMILTLLYQSIKETDRKKALELLKKKYHIK